jgi:hypothetical protein
MKNRSADTANPQGHTKIQSDAVVSSVPDIHLSGLSVGSIYGREVNQETQ